MALLNDRTRRVPTVCLLLSTALLFLGCSLRYHLGLGTEPVLSFSHKLHYEEEGLDCIVCHSTYDSEEQPGMPVLGTCMLCHEDIDAEKPEERRIATLFDGEVFRAQRISALDDEILFSHPDHALDEALCGTCHTGIEENERLDGGMAVSMDDCMRCHENLGVQNDCESCHAEIGEDHPPSTHSESWERTHGLVFRTGSELTANRCDLCHTEQGCNSCHFGTPPDNHTNHWRRRGHGITARMDRQNCYACHRTDSCDACHREVEPLSHNATWGSTLNRHCLSCHIANPQSGCTVCHQAAPSHSLGAPQPSDHSPGMNCLQCHGLFAPLPHVQKGEDCTICHPL